MSEEKSGEEKSKDPLSNEAWNWIMLLSGEIHNCSTQFLMFGSVVMVCIVACLGGVIAVLALKIPLSKYIAFVLLLLALFSGLEFKKERYVNQKRLKTLINIREDIISDESIDFIEVRRRWKEYIKKYYGKFLEKSERNNAKKELEDGKEDLEKKDIKETLHRIETKIEEGKKFTFRSVFGSFLIATGLGVISISIKPDLDIVATVSGLLMFIVGGVILSACYFNFKKQ